MTVRAFVGVVAFGALCAVPLAAQVPNTGSVKVSKTVANSTGGVASIPATFAMVLHCVTAGPANQPLAVPPGITGVTVGNIAGGSQCTVTEPPLAHIAHLDACHGGGATWSSMVSPTQPMTIVAKQTVTATVRNTLNCDPAPVACQKLMPNVTTCRLSLAIHRKKGPNAYTITVAPTAVTPTVNVAPSSSSSCANAAGGTVLLTNCVFYFNSNPTSVTLTASSSSGSLTGFVWAGACSGSAATCVVSVALAAVNVGASFP